MSASILPPPRKPGLSIRGLANFVLDYADSNGAIVTNMALNKLVYFVYEHFLLDQNTLITNAKIEAWEHGPVFREIYHSFKSNIDKPILERAKVFSNETLDMRIAELQALDSDLELIRKYLQPYMRYTGSQLRNISHAEGGPWHQVWWYKGHANPGMEITPDVILSSHSNKG